MRYAVLLLALPLWTACPRSTGPGPGAPSADAAVERDRAALVLPLTAATQTRALAALTRLGERARAGHLQAAWARAHYLIDLFDDARFRRDDHSLAVLRAALSLAGTPERGAEATDRALAGLIREVDAVLALDRLHARAVAARTVLEFDSRPPISRVGLLTRMAELKTIARGPGPLADNARLRLFGYCRQALEHAPTVRFAERMRVIAHCLYPLYDADPEPYFSTDPALRPPPPRWRDLARDLAELAERVARGQSSDQGASARAGAGRLAAAGRHLAADLAAFVDAHAAHLPALPDVAALDLPRAERATPYDWTPLVVLRPGAGGDIDVEAALGDLQALTRRIQGDGRRVLTVALARSAPAEPLLRAAEVAASAGAARLRLAVLTPQTLTVPPGDYWHGRLDSQPPAGTQIAGTQPPAGRHIARLAALELSLAPLEGTPEVRTPHWDPDRARLGLHLELGADTWQLTAPTGRVVTIAARDLARAQAELRRALARVYAAYPDEDALVLAPAPGQPAPIEAWVRAAEAARHDAQGRELMTQLGLARRAPLAGEDTLARRIERRAGATVDIQPSALAVRASVVRGCYQDVLEQEPALGGRFRLELRQGEVVVTQGPRSKALRACVVDGVAAMMRADHMASAVVELQPR